MKKIMFSAVLALLLVFCGTPVYAIPALPHAFCGSVMIDGLPAPDGTLVSATVAEGDVLTNSQNPVTTVDGSYGIDSSKLLVQGDIAGEDTVIFWVDGIETDQTATFEIGGGPTTVNLVVLIEPEEPEPEPEPEPSPPPTGGGGPSYIDVQTDFCGVTGSFNIDRDGKVLKTQTAGCKEGDLTVTIEKDTIALGENGKALQSLTIHEDTDPPPLPGNNFIGLPFILEPTGATFDPPLIFTWTYNPEDIPEGVTPVIVYWDGDEWITLTSVVDTENYTVTAEVSHFTTFALVVPVPVVEPEPVLPEPEKPVVEEPEEPIVEEPEVEEPLVEEPEVEEPEVEKPERPELIVEPEPGFPWGWIPGSVGGLGLLIWGIVYWRRKKKSNED